MRNFQKNVLLAIVAILLPLATKAQAAQEYVWMFKTFQLGEFHFKTGSPMQYKMNYDLIAGRLHFMQGVTMMELTETSRIDTVYVAGCKLVPMGLSFYEAVTSAAGHKVLIERTGRNVKVGNKGLFGIPTQANIYTTKVDATYGSTVLASNELSGENEIVRQVDECIYHIDHDGTRKELKKQSQFLSLFTKDKQKKLKDYTKQHNIVFGKPVDFLRLLDYALSL